MAGRKTKTEHLVDSIAGQHLALSVASHLARTQLVPDPLKIYDAQHLSEMLDHIASALARVAPLYVLEPGGPPRQLTLAELEGAVAQRGATRLRLRDGRTLSGVTLRRDDLRHSIAILKAIGLREIAPRFAPPAASEPAPRPNARESSDLLARLAAVEKLMEPPLLPGELEAAKAQVLFIARRAPHGSIADLAMRLVSALSKPATPKEAPEGHRPALEGLRTALEKAGREAD